MTSRAKRRRKSKPQEPGASKEQAPDANSDGSGEEGIPLTPNQERWLEMFFAVIVFFGATGGFTLELFGSWIFSAVAATIAAVVAVVLVRRGDKIF